MWAAAVQTRHRPGTPLASTVATRLPTSWAHRQSFSTLPQCFPFVFWTEAPLTNWESDSFICQQSKEPRDDWESLALYCEWGANYPKGSEGTACGCFSPRYRKEGKTFKASFLTLYLYLFSGGKLNAMKWGIASSELVTPKSVFVQENPSKLIIYSFSWNLMCFCLVTNSHLLCALLFLFVCGLLSINCSEKILYKPPSYYSKLEQTMFIIVLSILC